MVELKSETPIKEFPNIYNGNNTELKNMIKDLQDTIDKKVKDHKVDIDDLKVFFNTWTAKLQEAFDKKMMDLESRMEQLEENMKKIK